MFRTTAVIMGFLLMTGAAQASELIHTEDTPASLSQALAAPQKAPSTQGRRLLIPPARSVGVPEAPESPATPPEPQLAAAPEIDKPCPKNPYSGHPPKARTAEDTTAHGG